MPQFQITRQFAAHRNLIFCAGVIPPLPLASAIHF
jgi:hypothetical protein